MEKKLFSFYENITELNDEFIKYEDQDGNMQIFPKSYGILRVEHQKIDEAKRKIMIYEQEIKADDEFTKETITKQVPKSDITGDKDDITTIVDQDVEVLLIWKVSNALGLTQVFNNKEEALKYAGEVNARFIKTA